MGGVRSQNSESRSPNTEPSYAGRFEITAAAKDTDLGEAFNGESRSGFGMNTQPLAVIVSPATNTKINGLPPSERVRPIIVDP
jgi:hypothetical protein